MPVRRPSPRFRVATSIGAFTVPFIAATAQAQTAPVCDAAAFARLDLPGTRIVSANAVTDDESAPPHCVVRGAVNERTGTDGKPYAIGFEMRLPEDRNGRYFHQLNGGNDGAIVPAYGNLQGNPRQASPANEAAPAE